jgi:hypothetical protein
LSSRLIGRLAARARGQTDRWPRTSAKTKRWASKLAQKYHSQWFLGFASQPSGLFYPPLLVYENGALRRFRIQEGLPRHVLVWRPQR